MTLNPVKSPVLFSSICGCLALLAASYLPLWKAGYFYVVVEREEKLSQSVRIMPEAPEDGVFSFAGLEPPHPSTFWAAVEDARIAMRYGTLLNVLNRHNRDIVLAITLVAVGAVFGRLFYWRCWERL